MLILLKLFIDSLVSVHILTINENDWKSPVVVVRYKHTWETGQFQQSREAVSGSVGSYERLGNCRPATQVCSVMMGRCADPRRQEDDRSIFLWGQTLGVCHFCVVTVSVPSVLVP